MPQREQYRTTKLVDNKSLKYSSVGLPKARRTQHKGGFWHHRQPTSSSSSHIPIDQQPTPRPHIMLRATAPVFVPQRMRSACQFFQQGACRFGNNCRYLHIIPARPGEIDHEITVSEEEVSAIDRLFTIITSLTLYRNWLERSRSWP